MIRIRMYRLGFGDCFLVRFARHASRDFHLLIDCGALRKTPNLRAAVRDIIAETGGEIDLLVATHEHWDHASGFLEAEDLFTDPAQLRIHQVWLAWTENPEHPLASRLKEQGRARANALRLALLGLRAAEDRLGLDPGSGVSKQVDQVLGFLGADEEGRSRTEKAFRVVAKLGTQGLEYRSPAKDKEPVTVDGLPEYRFYVLGPPESEKMLARDKPRAGEVYAHGLALDDEGALLAPLIPDAPDLDELRELSLPFDRTYRIPLRQAAGMPFFERHYYGPAEGPVADQEWRRIDGDWLQSAAQVALRLDEDTNNTSLVLAIEEIASRRVLLFAGDAQVGNWLSWHDHTWKLPEGGAVTAADLLARTVVYKVGHHGSHNATLKGKGLELMTRREDLVALLPTAPGVYNNVPYDPLISQLETSTQGRILRSDEDPDSEQFKGRTVRSTELYHEYQF